MCLIIANPNGHSFAESYIDNAFTTNHDGFGVMWAKDGELKIKRGLFNRGEVKSILRRFHETETPYVAHFRYATHGSLNSANCHPFPIVDDLGGIAMVHNGTLSGKKWRDPLRSDTNLLAEKIKHHILREDFVSQSLFDNAASVISDRYKEAIGSDKLVFMNGLGEMSILNEKNGHWINGIWYSNLYSIIRQNLASKAISNQTAISTSPSYNYKKGQGNWKVQTVDDDTSTCFKVPRIIPINNLNE